MNIVFAFMVVCRKNKVMSCFIMNPDQFYESLHCHHQQVSQQQFKRLKHNEIKQQQQLSIGKIGIDK